MENNLKDLPQNINNQENVETQNTTTEAATEEKGDGEEEEEEEDDEEEEEEEDIELLEKAILEREAEDDDGGDEMSDEDENNAGQENKDTDQKPKKRKNIRKMLNEDELAEETRLEQDREIERIKWLRELHEKSQAEEREKKKALQEERKKQKSSESSKQVILLVDDSDGEGQAHTKKPKKEPPIITLSSDESDMEEKPLTGYDDTTGFVGGMHTDDSKNVCDSQGRVLVNVNHPPDEMDIFLTPKLARTVKKHQIGGIRFLYDNIIESVTRYKSSPGFGCILAHTMGLGKTLQTISFVDCCLRNTPVKTVLVVVPVNVLQNWVNEFDMWVPVTIPGEPQTGAEDQKSSTRFYPVYVVNDLLKTFEVRATLIKKWNESGGVMVLGYEMFRLLALTEPSYAVSRKLCRKRRKRGAPIKEVCDIDEEEFYMDLLTATQRSLLNPGPDIIVCDEGHRIKNAHATISKALKKIKTRRRIVLTGYPLQNNLEEYWCMVDFVRPNFLGTKNEFNNMFVRPIENGQCVDSTFKDTQLMKFRSHVLHSLLEGFVQRRDQSILQHTLQSKTEYVLCVKMTPVQRRLLRRFAQEMENEGGVNPIYAFTVLTKVWNHPDVLQDVVASSKMDDLDMDLPKATSKLSLDWATDELVGMRRGVVEDGAKMVLLLELIEESVAIGDKVVVFSQSLLTLSLIERFLQQRYLPEGCSTKNDIRTYFSNNSAAAKQTEGGPASPEYPAPTRLKWTKNKHYFRLDGSTHSQDREKLIKQFNQKNESAILFLISTRAGSLGVNLIGSNRVIIMDVSWNPCHDAQAVCRIYRYGQTKPSYVYRFVAENTLERTIYNKQITKQGMSSRVIDEQNVEKQFTSSEIVSSTDNLEMMPAVHPDGEENAWTHMIPDISDTVLRSVLERHTDLLTAAPFTHESLLIENKNERLTQEEKMLAKKSYQFEKQMNKGFGGYSNTYSKPVNRVTPMCKAAPRPGPGSQPLPPIDTSSTGTSHWSNKAPATGVPLEEFAEKYNAQNWSPLIKPLSPLQPNEEATLRSFQNIPQQEHQSYHVRQQLPQNPQQNLTTPRSANNVTKPRSILPAPPTNNYNPQSYMMNNLPSQSTPQPPAPQPPLKLPLPRLPPQQTPVIPPPKRVRKPSKVISSVRPTQAVLSQGEDGKCTYKVPISRMEPSSQTASKDCQSACNSSTIKPGSITDALRAIDERTIEPPTVSVQRMIEQNECLRRQVEMDGFLPLRSTHHQIPMDLQLEDAMSPILGGSNTTPSATPTRSIGDITPTTTPGAASTQSEDTSEESKDQSEHNTTSESKEEDTAAKKPKKRSTKKSTSQSMPQQVVYQAIPAQALQSNQGYQLLIQMPGGAMSNQAKVVPATQIINGQQFLSGGQQVVGNQPIFIQKQATPLQLQMPVGSKTVYLVSQPSNGTQQQIQQVPQSTTAQIVSSVSTSSLDQYIIPTSQPEPTIESKEATPESTTSSSASTPKHDVIQQTPPPTILSPINYDSQRQAVLQQHQDSSQLHPQQVVIQQQSPYNQFQFQQQQQAQQQAYQQQYQPYFSGGQIIQPRMMPNAQIIQPRMMPQQMYMQPSQIQRVQQKPKIKPKPKSAAKRSRKPKPATPADSDTIDSQVSAQMHANILAQQKQRQLTQMHYNPGAMSAAYQQPRPSYHPTQPYYNQGISPAQSLYTDPNRGQVLGQFHHDTQAARAKKPEQQRQYYNPEFQNQLYQQQMQAFGQYGQVPQHYPGYMAHQAEKKPEEKKPSSKRKSRKKTDDSDNHVNIQIHSPISFPTEKKQKKAKKASTECPYSQPERLPQQSAPGARAPQHMNYPQLQHQQHLYQNMVNMYRQQQQQAQHQQASYQPQQQPPQLLYKQYLQKQAPLQQKQPQQQQQQQPPPQRSMSPQFWSPYQQHSTYQEQRYQFSDERTSSPPSGDEMDVNQFLNIPVKNEPAGS